MLEALGSQIAKAWMRSDLAIQVQTAVIADLFVVSFIIDITRNPPNSIGTYLVCYFQLRRSQLQDWSCS